jgi:hypothetical protein
MAVEAELQKARAMAGSAHWTSCWYFWRRIRANMGRKAVQRRPHMALRPTRTKVVSGVVALNILKWGLKRRREVLYRSLLTLTDADSPSG